MHPDQWTPTRRDWAVFSVFAAVLVLLRLFLIVTNQWSPEFGGDFPEALVSGRAAFDILNGSWRGWFAYMYATGGHLGNELAASIFALPLFWLLGPSLLALAAVPIAAAVVTAAFVFRLSRSREAAILATAYLVFMPLAVQSWQIYPYFSHAEVATWFLLALWILRPVLSGAAAGTARPFLAGLVLGVGLVLCDIQIVALPSIVAAWYLSKAPRPAKTVVWWAGAGVILGALPYAVYNLMTPESVPLFYWAQFGLAGAPGDWRSYPRSFALPASMLWPLANLASAPRARFLMAVAGAAVVIWWGRRLLRLPRPPAVDLAVLGFIVIFCVLNVMTRNTVGYYTFALAAPIAFVAGGVLADLTRRWKLVACIVVGMGLMLVVPSLMSVDLSVLKKGWHATRIARGYSFYWPEHYQVFSGYKTQLGREVERVASQAQFSEPPNPVPPEKVIFIAEGLTQRYLLRAPEDYYTYGADVTFLGVARLAAQIVSEIEPRFWPETFGSMAVFAANDLLIGELVGMFADGTIDRSVPDCCVKMFYSELGRKIRDRSGQHRQDVNALLDGLPPAKRAWVDSGIAESQYVDYRVPLWPKRAR